MYASNEQKLYFLQYSYIGGGEIMAMRLDPPERMWCTVLWRIVNGRRLEFWIPSNTPARDKIVAPVQSDYFKDLYLIGNGIFID